MAVKLRLRGLVILAMLVTASYSGAEAGSHLFPGHGNSGCGCQSSAPVRHSAPLYNAGCACTAAASTCCGMGGIHNIGGIYMDSAVSAGSISGHGESWQGAYREGSLTGYEGLPNLDGGGVNYRYPYHSYRRPWFHPGPRAANISIVW